MRELQAGLVRIGATDVSAADSLTVVVVLVQVLVMVMVVMVQLRVGVAKGAAAAAAVVAVAAGWRSASLQRWVLVPRVSTTFFAVRLSLPCTAGSRSSLACLLQKVGALGGGEQVQQVVASTREYWQVQLYRRVKYSRAAPAASLPQSLTPR